MTHPGHPEGDHEGGLHVEGQDTDTSGFHFQNEYWATVGSEPDAHAPYDPGDLIALGKAIRHLPMVVAHCVQKAQECIEMIGSGSDNFEIVLQNRPDTERPRAYIAPANSDGIRAEITDAVLLKAAQNMEGR